MAITSVELPTFEENLKKAFWSEDCMNKTKVDDARSRDGPSGFKKANPVPPQMHQQQKKQKKSDGAAAGPNLRLLWWA